MTHATRFAAVAVLVALVLLNVSCESQTPEIDFEPEETDAPVQAQTPEIDALRVRAEQGDARAQYNLALWYAFGQGDLEDDAEAVRLYRLAADQGHADAQSNLGLLYENGEGVPQDYVQAHMWTNLAVAQFSGEDRDRRERNRDIIAAKMTAEQVVEAQRLAREWYVAHPREP